MVWLGAGVRYRLLRDGVARAGKLHPAFGVGMGEEQGMTYDELLKFSQSLLAENAVFRRENAILREELKYRIAFEHWELNHGMTREEADRLAERDITHMVLHNEGAE